MNPLDELARTDIDPALLVQVRASFTQQQAELAQQRAKLAEKDFKIAGLTLAEWIGRIGVALQPLADRLAELLRQHADETLVRQLDPGSGNTRHAYLWTYRSGGLDDGPPIVVFDYQASRAGAHARAFLHGWRGHLMVEGFRVPSQRGLRTSGFVARASVQSYPSVPAKP